jgi:hypothetical protein
MGKGEIMPEFNIYEELESLAGAWNDAARMLVNKPDAVDALTACSKQIIDLVREAKGK